jgi:hypothetical protein
MPIYYFLLLFVSAFFLCCARLIRFDKICDVDNSGVASFLTVRCRRRDIICIFDPVFHRILDLYPFRPLFLQGLHNFTPVFPLTHNFRSDIHIIFPLGHGFPPQKHTKIPTKGGFPHFTKHYAPVTPVNYICARY